MSRHDRSSRRRALCLALAASPWVGAQVLANAVSANEAGPHPVSARNGRPLRVAVPGNVFSGLEAGKPTGVLIEAVDAILKAQGQEAQYLRMLSSDAIRELRQGRVDMATALIPSSTSDARILYSSPILNEFNVVVTRKGQALNFDSIGDLQGRQIAGRVGYRYPLLEADSRIRINRYSTDAEMIRALLMGREEILIFSAVSDLYAFRAEGVSSRLQISEKAVGSVPLVVAFSAARFTAADVQQFNEQLANLKQSPAWESIVDRNGMSDLIREWPTVKA